MGGTPTPLPVPDPGPTAQAPDTETGATAAGVREYPKQAILGKEAVFAAIPWHRAIEALGDMASDAKWDRQELTLTVRREDVVSACRALQSAGYNFFSDLTAVDWYPQEPRIQLSYHLLSHELKQRVRLVARLDSGDLTVDSITGVWPSSNFYEREVFDLFGVNFAGHPGLTRIMMPPDWKGHPLRKDYPVEGYR